MPGFPRLKNSFNKVKKVKHVRWLLPGWVFYEYYKMHKGKGDSKRKSFGYGIKAEAIRLVALTSVPLPGTYELTTTGLALLKKKIEKGEVDEFTLRSFRDFTPLKNLKFDKEKLIKEHAYIKPISRGKKLYFKIFYKEK